ncbi:MAG: Hint domain-containing protein [Litoreibacter sp.]
MARISEIEFSGADEIEIALTQAEYDAMIAADGTASAIEYTVQQYDLVVGGGSAEFQVSEETNANSSVTFDASSTWTFDPETAEWVTAAPIATNGAQATNFLPNTTGTATNGYDSLGLYSSQSGTDTPIQMMSISVDGVPATTATISDGPMAGGSATIEHYDWDALAQPSGFNYLEFNQPNPTDPVFSMGDGFGTDSGVCFAAGTLITTDQGEKPVEDLCIGDQVLTLDHGYKTIKWIGCSRHTAATLARKPNLRPIVIKNGALGLNLPVGDLVVSRQHRVLVQSIIAERMFAQREILVAACALLPLDGVDIVEAQADVAYFHVMCEQHEILQSNGAWTESLYAGKESLKSISPEARQELYDIMPELVDFDSLGTPAPARLIVEGHKRNKLVERHVQNRKPMTVQ